MILVGTSKIKSPRSQLFQSRTVIIVCVLSNEREWIVTSGGEAISLEPTPAVATSSVSSGDLAPPNTLLASSHLSPEEISQIAAAVAGIIHPVSTTAQSNPLMSGSQAGILAGSSAPTTSNTSTASAGNSG